MNAAQSGKSCFMATLEPTSLLSLRTKLTTRIAALVFWCVLLGTTSGAAELKQKTATAFNHYVSVSEGRMASDLAQNRFLWMDGLPEPRRHALYDRLLRGDVIVQHLETRDAGRRIPIPGGLVHHWIAVTFIRGVTLKQTIDLLQDYAQQQNIYRPEIVRSAVLRNTGGEFVVYCRLSYNGFVTVTYDVDLDVQYTRLALNRELSRSVSTRIVEVDDPGMPTEHKRPAGRDRGFLWRLYTYGRYEEKDGGVYVQLEIISLSRTVPAILAWFVNPYLKKVPTEYLSEILNSTRKALNDRSKKESDRLRVTIGTPIARPALSVVTHLTCENFKRKCEYSSTR